MPRRDPLVVLARVRRLALDAARQQAARAAGGLARIEAANAALDAQRGEELQADPARYAAWRPALQAQRVALLQAQAEATAAATLARDALAAARADARTTERLLETRCEAARRDRLAREQAELDATPRRA